MGRRALFVWSSACFCTGCAAGALSRPGFIFLAAIAAFFIAVIFLRTPRRIMALLPLVFALGCFYFSVRSLPSFSRERDMAESAAIRPFFLMKERLSLNIKGNLSPSSSALALGILFGDRSGFSGRFKEDLERSGTTHIVALSGFNITVVISFIGAVFFFLAPRWRPAAITTGIIIFVAVVGPSASVIRAAIMGALVVFAKNSGRLVDIKGPIAFAALAMVIHDPSAIALDAGFSLSFLALFGIVFISPKIKDLLFKKENPGGIKSAFAECLSAELAVAPALMVFFGSVSWFSFIPNLMIIWSVPFAMAFSFASGLASFVSEWLAFPLSVAAESLLSYEIWVINFFARYFQYFGF